MEAAVYIDGGYISTVLRNHFDEIRIDYGAFAEWAAGNCNIYRSYYYDCLPYQSPQPTKEERERVSGAQRFFNALKRLDRFKVREGRLEYRGDDEDGNPIFQQKRVDILLGLDIARDVTKREVDLVVLVSGDSDLIPAVDVAQSEGTIVRLVHGPGGSFHQDLWDKVDERKEMRREDLNRMER